MEAFYEGEEKGEDDRKEKSKEVKPWGGLFFVPTLMHCMVVLFEEITYYNLRADSSKRPAGSKSV